MTQGTRLALVVGFTSRLKQLIGKHRALSREVTCNFRLYLEIG